MTKKGTCELCGLPDNSYTIEDGGKVFKVCKLCHDGFAAKQGIDPSELSGDAIDRLVEEMEIDIPQKESKVETLSPDQMAKLLKPSGDEKRKLYASLRKANALKTGGENTLSADTEQIKQELLQLKDDIEEESIKRAVTNNVRTAASGLGDAVDSENIDQSVEASMKKLIGSKSPSEREQEQIDNDIRQRRAELKAQAAREKLAKDANPTIDDDRIKITSPEVELKKDIRPKTNYDVATKEHVGAIRFLEAFKYVMHPVSYSAFAGVIVLAVATVLMILSGWKIAVIDFFAGAGAVAVGFLLVWYLKRRFEVDKRTLLLRMRQEQIIFDSIGTACYRELKTKYPIIKAFGWLLGRLSVILSAMVVIGGSIAAVITTFLVEWYWFAPILAGSAIAATLVYYLFKFAADFVNYKLDLERNQQLIQQSLLDLLAKKK